MDEYKTLSFDSKNYPGSAYLNRLRSFQNQDLNGLTISSVVENTVYSEMNNLYQDWKNLGGFFVKIF